jgi:acyl-phosphate glycerol 3-phosphate acyltransferase
MNMVPLVISIILAYLIGAIPTAYIFGRVLKGIDIRKHGSGNMGATNAFRVLGKGPGIIVLHRPFNRYYQRSDPNYCDRQLLWFT